MIDEYDMIVIDECGEARRHYVGETMKHVLSRVLGILKRLLAYGKRSHVFLMQHNLSEYDISFYCKLAG